MKSIKLLDIIVSCETKRIVELIYLYMREVDCTIGEPAYYTIKVYNAKQKDVAKYKKFARLLGGVKISVTDEKEIWG